MNYIVGIVGMLFTICGTLVEPGIFQNICFLTGAFVLLVAAYLGKHSFFVALQITAFVGAAMAFLPLQGFVQGIVPGFCTAGILVFFARTQKLKSFENILGAIGITVLAIGYATSQPMVYFFGGILLMAYSAISFFQGSRIAAMWFVLNLVFIITSGFVVYRLFAETNSVFI